MVRAAVRGAVTKAVQAGAVAVRGKGKEDVAVRNAWSVPGKMIRSIIRGANR
jgi:hypothetical protein